MGKKSRKRSKSKRGSSEDALRKARTQSIITDTISGKGVDLDSEDLIRRADKNAEERVMDALCALSLSGNQ